MNFDILDVSEDSPDYEADRGDVTDDRHDCAADAHCPPCHAEPVGFEVLSDERERREFRLFEK
jgi:hypothetical protein